MKSGKRILIAAGLMAGGAWLMRGELEPWIQHTRSGPAIAALFRSVPMPGGAVPILRPPTETRSALSSLISSAPRDAMLYRLRAREAEVALDFTAAEGSSRAQGTPPHAVKTQQLPDGIYAEASRLDRISRHVTLEIPCV